MSPATAAVVLLLLAALGGSSEWASGQSGSGSAWQMMLDEGGAAFQGGQSASEGTGMGAAEDKSRLIIQATPDHLLLRPLQWENASSRRAEVLRPREDVRDFGTVIDISPDPSEYIPGAISIPYTEFLLPGGALKTVPEMAAILGAAGISRDDPVLIYGECQPCGGGPSAASYVYWIMKYLGQGNLSLLDGGIDDWVGAGEPTAAGPSHLPSANYIPTPRADILASYEFVRSGSAQIIDARTEQEFEAGSIPGSINIPYTRVLEGKRIKDDAALADLFSSLDREQPVVVYTNTGIKASMVWLALTLQGYDAAIYSWKDWQSNSA